MELLMKNPPTIIFVSTNSFLKELKEYYNPAIPWFLRKEGEREVLEDLSATYLFPLIFYYSPLN